MKYEQIPVVGTKIRFHPKLVSTDQSINLTLKAVFGKDLTYFCLMHPPFCTKENNEYHIIGRHYSFWQLILTMNQPEDLIPVILIDKADIEKVQRMDESLIKTLHEMNNSIGYQTRIKRIRIESGLLCPFCNSRLKQPYHHATVDHGKYKGQFRLSCSNSECAFFAHLTNDEYKLFRKRKYPTSKWLQVLDSKCPHCDSFMVLRTRGETRAELCSSNFVAGVTCKPKMSGEPNESHS